MCNQNSIPLSHNITMCRGRIITCSITRFPNIIHHVNIEVDLEVEDGAEEDLDAKEGQ
jgi:hypothetical protein